MCESKGRSTRLTFCSPTSRPLSSPLLAAEDQRLGLLTPRTMDDAVTVVIQWDAAGFRACEVDIGSGAFALAYPDRLSRT